MSDAFCTLFITIGVIAVVALVTSMALSGCEKVEETNRLFQTECIKSGGSIMVIGGTRHCLHFRAKE